MIKCKDCSRRETCNMRKSLELDSLSESIKFTCYYFDRKDKTKGGLSK